MVPARWRVRPGQSAVRPARGGPARGPASLVRRAGPDGARPATASRPARPVRPDRIRPDRVRPAARVRAGWPRAIGLRAATAWPGAALRRGRTEARRDPAPAAGRRRDPGRRLRLHPPQPQGHPGPGRRGHDDLRGRLRRDHPDAAQRGQPRPAHGRPAADHGPGHPPGRPDHRGGGARVRAFRPADHHRAGHPGRAARPDHRPGRRRPADQRRGRLADHPPQAAQPAAGHPARAAGRAGAAAGRRRDPGDRGPGRRTPRGVRASSPCWGWWPWC